MHFGHFLTFHVLFYGFFPFYSIQATGDLESSWMSLLELVERYWLVINTAKQYRCIISSACNFAVPVILQ